MRVCEYVVGNLIRIKSEAWSIQIFHVHPQVESDWLSTWKNVVKILTSDFMVGKNNHRRRPAMLSLSLSPIR